MSVELVTKIKADLEARGADLSGPCGAFQITKRVAWALRNEGYGLLGGKTPGQNGCTVNGERYAVDWILKPDGHGVDVLRDAGGDNEPIWIEEEASPYFYRPAIDPGDVSVPPPVPDPGTNPPDPGLPPAPEVDGLTKRLDALLDLAMVFANRIDELDALLAAQNLELTEELRTIKAKLDRSYQSNKVPYFGVVTLTPKG